MDLFNKVFDDLLEALFEECEENASKNKEIIQYKEIINTMEKGFPGLFKIFGYNQKQIGSSFHIQLNKMKNKNYIIKSTNQFNLFFCTENGKKIQFIKYQNYHNYKKNNIENNFICLILDNYFELFHDFSDHQLDIESIWSSIGSTFYLDKNKFYQKLNGIKPFNCAPSLKVKIFYNIHFVFY